MNLVMVEVRNVMKVKLVVVDRILSVCCIGVGVFFSSSMMWMCLLMCKVMVVLKVKDVVIR